VERLVSDLYSGSSQVTSYHREPVNHRQPDFLPHWTGNHHFQTVELDLPSSIVDQEGYTKQCIGLTGYQSYRASKLSNYS